MEPREEFGWADARKFLTDPDSAFERVKDLPLREDVKLLVGHLAVFSVLETAALLLLRSYGPLAPLFRVLSPDEGALSLTLKVLLVLGIAVPAIFLTAAVIHIGVVILGGRGYRKTLKAAIYGEIPFYYFGWIPLVGFVFAIWGLVVTIRGLAKFHGFSGWKALGAYCIGGLIGGIAIGAILVAFLAAFVLSLGPPISAPALALALVEANSTHLCVEHRGGDSIRWTGTLILVDGVSQQYEGGRDCRAGSAGYDLCGTRFYTGISGRITAGERAIVTVGEGLNTGSRVTFIDERSSQQIASFTVPRTQAGSLTRCA